MIFLIIKDRYSIIQSFEIILSIFFWEGGCMKSLMESRKNSFRNHFDKWIRVIRQINNLLIDKWDKFNLNSCLVNSKLVDFSSLLKDRFQISRILLASDWSTFSPSVMRCMKEKLMIYLFDYIPPPLILNFRARVQNAIIWILFDSSDFRLTKISLVSLTVHEERESEWKKRNFLQYKTLRDKEFQN